MGRFLCWSVRLRLGLARPAAGALLAFGAWRKNKQHLQRICVPVGCSSRENFHFFRSVFFYLFLRKSFCATKVQIFFAGEKFPQRDGRGLFCARFTGSRNINLPAAFFVKFFFTFLRARVPILRFSGKKQQRTILGTFSHLINEHPVPGPKSSRYIFFSREISNKKLQGWEDPLFGNFQKFPFFDHVRKILEIK